MVGHFKIEASRILLRNADLPYIWCSLVKLIRHASEKPLYALYFNVAEQHQNLSQIKIFHSQSKLRSCFRILS